MRVLVVADRFGPALGAVAAADELRTGWLEQAPDDVVVAHGLSDGSIGFLEAVAAGLQEVPTPVVVTGPTGEPTPAELLTAHRAGVLTAYLESAQATGRHLIDDATLAAPDRLDSHGVGELLLAARETHAPRVVLGVGDLACHDGGLGMLQALGAGAWLEDLPAVRQDWAGIELVLAHATGVPLLGFHGASATLGTEHGVASEVTQRLESRMGRLAERAAAVLPPQRDLLTGLARRLDREPGSGAGGGLGYGLLLLGARPVAGARLLIDEQGLAEAMPGSLVVAGTPTYDWRSVHDGVVAEVARCARDVAAPTVVLAEEVAVGRREGMSLGISGTYGALPGEDLGRLATRVARTWSPRR